MSLNICLKIKILYGLEDYFLMSFLINIFFNWINGEQDLQKGLVLVFVYDLLCVILWVPSNVYIVQVLETFEQFYRCA